LAVDDRAVRPAARAGRRRIDHALVAAEGRGGASDDVPARRSGRRPVRSACCFRRRRRRWRKVLLWIGGRRFDGEYLFRTMTCRVADQGHRSRGRAISATTPRVTGAPPGAARRIGPAMASSSSSPPASASFNMEDRIPAGRLCNRSLTAAGSTATPPAAAASSTSPSSRSGRACRARPGAASAAQRGPSGCTRS